MLLISRAFWTRDWTRWQWAIEWPIGCPPRCGLDLWSALGDGLPAFLPSYFCNLVFVLATSPCPVSLGMATCVSSEGFRRAWPRRRAQTRHGGSGSRGAPRAGIVRHDGVSPGVACGLGGVATLVTARLELAIIRHVNFEACFARWVPPCHATHSQRNRPHHGPLDITIITQGLVRKTQCLYSTDRVSL